MELKDFFKANPKVAIGFSGGADSAFLLYAGMNCGADIKPYYVKSAFQPEFELEDAKRLCNELGMELTIIDLDVLCSSEIVSNPKNRCYYCKQRIFGAIWNQAKADGYNILIDGTNASDSSTDRPGMQALCELEVKSPLRDCGITKDELRALSREAGLFTWNKPSYACLATRIPTGEAITADKLERVEAAENEMFKMGFSDFRIRFRDGKAVVQVPVAQLEKAAAEWDQITAKIKRFFSEIVLDQNGR